MRKDIGITKRLGLPLILAIIFHLISGMFDVSNAEMNSIQETVGVIFMFLSILNVFIIPGEIVYTMYLDRGGEHKPIAEFFCIILGAILVFIVILSGFHSPGTSVKAIILLVLIIGLPSRKRKGKNGEEHAEQSGIFEENN